MEKSEKQICFAWLGICLMAPVVGFAEKCAGTNVNNMTAWDANEISQGMIITTFRHTSVIVSENPSAPYHLAAGECGGTFLTTPDGKTQGWGHCARKDKDGDVLNEAWTLPLGTSFKGNWKLVGGTGKYANSSGTATWEVAMSQGKMAAVRWTGNCQ